MYVKITYGFNINSCCDNFSCWLPTASHGKVPNRPGPKVLVCGREELEILCNCLWETDQVSSYVC